MSITTTTEGDAALTDELRERLDDNLTRNIRALIGQRRLRRSDLYDALGMSRQTFSARLTLVSRFTATELLIIAHLLGVPAERLAEEPDHLLRVGDPPGESIADRLDRVVGPTLRTGSRWFRDRRPLRLVVTAMGDGVATA